LSILSVTDPLALSEVGVNVALVPKGFPVTVKTVLDENPAKVV
jgi:hypothetical protein